MKNIPHVRISFLLLFIFNCWSCSHVEPFRYEMKQAVLIHSLREQMFYEYSSPLNEAMKIYIELELANEPLIKLPLEKVYEMEKKIKKEKPLLGCYYRETNVGTGDKKLFIIMEWNNNVGVVIRLFTNSNYVVDKLPNASF